MSEFEYGEMSTDELMAALATEYEADPAGITANLIEEAARDQLEHLQPAIDAVLEGQRQSQWEANSAEAVAAMDKLYGDAWRPYKDAVNEYIGANPDVIESVIGDPQRLAERLQAVYRSVRPQVDAKQREGEWNSIASSYRSYSDPVRGRD